MVRSFRLLQDDITVVCLRKGPLTVLQLNFSEASVAHQNFLHELLLRVFWRILSWLRRGHLEPKRLISVLNNRSTLRCTPRFFRVRCTSASLTQPSGLIVQRWCQYAGRTGSIFFYKPRRNVIVPWLSEHAVSARVRAQLIRMSPLWPDLESTAKALHLSSSTLQRHLMSEGASFQSLKDQLRRDMAIVRLNSSTVPLAKLAGELGFADSALSARFQKLDR